MRLFDFFRVGLLISCLGLVFVGCRGLASRDSSSTNATNVLPETSVTSNILLTPMLPTATLLPVFTSPFPSTPIATSTLIPEQTPESLPTLLPDQAEALILDLYQNNAGCLLPCFWGLTPGQSEWRTAKAFLKTFVSKIYDTSDANLLFAEVYLPNFQDTSTFPTRHFFIVQDGIITMIEAHILPTPSYAIPTILDTYGQPDEVWLLTAKASREDFLGFTVRLFYPQHNFILSYGTQGTIQDAKVQGCFSKQDKSLRLVVWSSQEELTYPEAVSGVHELPDLIYDRPLEEATGMSIDKFYETFKDTEEPICLETPTELWPGP